MNNINIGKTIAEMRKQTGATQEALASAVGVTAQAVSKWESGGSPDIELLAPIADFFSVSIDRLFGRCAADYTNIQAEMAKSICAIDSTKDRLQKVFQYCWTLELAIMGHIPEQNEKSIDDIANENTQNLYSQMQLNSGITSLGINEQLRYFLIMPEPSHGWIPRLHFKPEFTGLFSFLSDSDTLKAVLLLYSRENKAFTPKLLIKELGITLEKSVSILSGLHRYDMISQSEIELDDETQVVFKFKPNAAMIPFLTFADEIVNCPHSFYYADESRSNPWLRGQEDRT